MEQVEPSPPFRCWFSGPGEIRICTLVHRRQGNPCTAASSIKNFRVRALRIPPKTRDKPLGNAQTRNCRCRGPHFAWSVEANLTSPRRGDDFSGMTAETMLLTRLCLACEPLVEIVPFNRRAMPSVGSPRCARSVGSSRDTAA